VVHDRRVVAFSLISGVAWFVIFATVFSFSTSTAKTLGASGPQLGVFSVLYSVGTIAGAWFISTRAGHAMGERTPLVAGFLILALYCVGIGYTRDLRLFYSAQLVCGFGKGLLMACGMAFAIKRVDPEKRSTAMGCYQSIYCIGITGGPIVMGVLMDHVSRQAAFSAVGAVAVLCALTVAALYRTGYLAAEPGGVG
jgi:MFS family permease